MRKHTLKKGVLATLFGSILVGAGFGLGEVVSLSARGSKSIVLYSPAYNVNMSVQLQNATASIQRAATQLQNFNPIESIYLRAKGTTDETALSSFMGIVDERQQQLVLSFEAHLKVLHAETEKALVRACGQRNILTGGLQNIGNAVYGSCVKQEAKYIEKWVNFSKQFVDKEFRDIVLDMKKRKENQFILEEALKISQSRGQALKRQLNRNLTLKEGGYLALVQSDLSVLIQKAYNLIFTTAIIFAITKALSSILVDTLSHLKSEKQLKGLFDKISKQNKQLLPPANRSAPVGNGNIRKPLGQPNKPYQSIPPPPANKLNRRSALLRNSKVPKMNQVPRPPPPPPANKSRSALLKNIRKPHQLKKVGQSNKPLQIQPANKSRSALLKNIRKPHQLKKIGQSNKPLQIPPVNNPNSEPLMNSLRKKLSQRRRNLNN